MKEWKTKFVSSNIFTKFWLMIGIFIKSRATLSLPIRKCPHKHVMRERLLCNSKSICQPNAVHNTHLVFESRKNVDPIFCFFVDGIAKAWNDNRICLCGSRSQIHWKKKPSIIRFECDGKRRSEFGCSLAVCATTETEDLFETESLNLAQSGERSSYTWPTDGGILQTKAPAWDSLHE